MRETLTDLMTRACPRLGLYEPLSQVFRERRDSREPEHPQDPMLLEHVEQAYHTVEPERVTYEDHGGSGPRDVCGNL